MRTPLIAANWKMNKTEKEAIAFVKAFKPLLGSTAAEVLLCPPYTLLSVMHKELAGSSIKLGAQNLYFEEKGAFTGEISAAMVKEYCEYAIIGHSERRKIFGEGNEVLNKKIRKALEHRLKVIYCVGETLEERESGVTNSVIETQLREGLIGINDFSEMVIAYEPVWAIGTGRTATPAQAQEVHAFIRKLLRELYGAVAEKTRILYGGSVKPENTRELMDKADIDGALVGGAALDPASFAGIVKY